MACWNPKGGASKVDYLIEPPSLMPESPSLAQEINRIREDIEIALKEEMKK